jgi:pyridoxal/pyridoxine/pyridoxamine kinase
MNSRLYSVVETLMSGLTDNGLDDSYTHVLTGYVRNETFLLEVIKTVRKLKEKNPKLLYGK